MNNPQTIPKDNKDYDTAYFAYLKVFDANSKKERRELLNQILLHPYISYLFVNNCFPNTEELEAAFNILSIEPKSSFLYFKHNNPTDAQREILIKTLVKNHQYSLKTAMECNLNSEEKSIFFKILKQNFKPDNLKEYLKFCLMFQDLVSEKEVQDLVDHILESHDKESAEEITNSSLELTENMKDKLCSLFVINKLSEN